MPPEMANNDAAGAEAAARYFIDVYGYTYISRDLRLFEDMAHTDCVFCNSVIAEVEEMIADGETQAGGLVSVDAVTSNEYHEDFGVHILEMETTQRPYVELDHLGKVIEESDGSSLNVSMIVQMKPDGWVVLEAGSGS
ncbi:MAG: hypothetical protein EOL89_02095 [Actinobacteria bacterium]|nr:hypothetical protein [Actinomycetota bacterium]